MGSWHPAPGTWRLIPIDLAELSKQGIHTSTAVCTSDSSLIHEDFVLEHPGTSDFDPLWGRNMDILRAWLENPLQAQDEMFTGALNDEGQAAFVPVRLAVSGEFNDCRIHQVCE